MQHIFRVAELTRAVKDVVEGQFPFVWVRGQVSNLARPGSGHIYFSLKDAEAVLGVVWFKGNQAVARLEGGESYDPVTGEVLEQGDPSGGLGAGLGATLANGAEVLCAGRLTVYPPRGAYQLVAEVVQDMGLGKLYLEFEALKRKLADKGYFDAAAKLPLPAECRRVAVITAPGGAAIRDFLRVGQERGLGCEARLYPVLVQGEAAPEQIAGAVRQAVADGFAQCVVLIRGGGSIEDLWAFNTEVVAKAVKNCPLPVLTGVGHEVDTTIADLVADVRAATPSHAAQLLWPERAALAQRLDEAELGLHAAWSRFERRAFERLAGFVKALQWLSPMGQVRRLEERIAGLVARLSAAGRNLPGRGEARLDALGLRLSQAARISVTAHGSRLEEATRRFAALGPSLVTQKAAALEALTARADVVTARAVDGAAARLDLLAARLSGLDPMRPLARGYALARKADGTFVTGVGQVSPGETLCITVQDGNIESVVNKVTKA